MLNEILLNIAQVMVISVSPNITINKNLLNDRDQRIHFHRKVRWNSQDPEHFIDAKKPRLFNKKELQ